MQMFKKYSKEFEQIQEKTMTFVHGHTLTKCSELQKVKYTLPKRRLRNK